MPALLSFAYFDAIVMRALQEVGSDHAVMVYGPVSVFRLSVVPVPTV